LGIWEGVEASRVSQQCPWRLYRARGGQSRDFTSGNGLDVAAARYMIRARITLFPLLEGVDG
jgi:hypothetical protein